MRLRALFVAFLLVCALPACAAIPKILMVGDSWPWFMMLNQAFTTALDEAGLGQYEAVGMYTTAPGSTAKQWTRPEWLQIIDEQLAANPTIDIVHLSLGGNDYLRKWKPSMPLPERDALFNDVRDDIETVVKHILDVRPNVRVAIVEYDYVNDEREHSGYGPLNQAGQILAKMKLEMSKKYDRCGYVQDYGLMQYHFGVPPDIPPHTVPLPGQANTNFEPFPGGAKDYGNAPEAMMDAIHLSPKGYHVLALHCIDVLYRSWIENPLPAK